MTTCCLVAFHLTSLQGRLNLHCSKEVLPCLYVFLLCLCSTTGTIIYKYQLEYILSDPFQVSLVREQFVQRCLLVFKHCSPGGDLPTFHMQGGKQQGVQDNIYISQGEQFPFFSESNHSGIHIRKQHEAFFSLLFIQFMHLVEAFRSQQVIFEIMRIPKHRHMIKLQ